VFAALVQGRFSSGAESPGPAISADESNMDAVENGCQSFN